MKVVNFTFAQLGTLSWTADEDVILIGFSNVSTRAVVSREPGLTWALWTTITNSSVDQLERLGAFQAFPYDGFRSGLDFDLSAGQKIFVSSDGTSGIVQLFFETIPA